MREDGTTGVSRGHSTRPPAGKDRIQTRQFSRIPMNTEQQSQGVAYQPEFDFSTQMEWARPLGGGEGAIPTAAPMREQQVFTAWKEELNWDERLLEREYSECPQAGISGGSPNLCFG